MTNQTIKLLFSYAFFSLIVSALLLSIPLAPFVFMETYKKPVYTYDLHGESSPPRLSFLEGPHGVRCTCDRVLRISLGLLSLKDCFVRIKVA